MQGSDTLETLVRLQQAEIQWLTKELAEAEAEHDQLAALHAAVCINREQVAGDIQSVRFNSSIGLSGQRVSVHAHQSHCRMLELLSIQLQRLNTEAASLLHRLEAAAGRVENLRVRMIRHVGEKSSFGRIAERLERAEALRAERAVDEAMLEQWSAQARRE